MIVDRYSTFGFDFLQSLNFGFAYRKIPSLESYSTHTAKEPSRDYPNFDSAT
jgi:hypothetical protein